MHFSLLDAKKKKIVTEKDVRALAETNEPLILHTNNNWEIHLNAIISSIKIEDAVKEIKDALKRRNKGSLELERVERTFSHSSTDAMQLPFLYDAVNGVKYLSLGIVHAASNGVKNASFHRIEFRESGAFIFIGKGDLNKMMESKSGPLSVYISNPSLPEVAIASSLSLGYGEDEMELASELCKIEGKNMPVMDIEESVPAESNLLIEGEIEKDVVEYPEIFYLPTGPIKERIPYHRLKIRKILYDDRKAYGIIQGGSEHRLLYEIAKKITPKIKAEI